MTFWACLLLVLLLFRACGCVPLGMRAAFATADVAKYKLEAKEHAEKAKQARKLAAQTRGPTARDEAVKSAMSDVLGKVSCHMSRV